ncbi:MAG: histidinol-phosphatase [Opitutales bacterium]
MKFDCHMHTPLCGHAYGEPTEFVEQAARRGLGLITFTCHIPMDEAAAFGGPTIRMAKSRLDEYRQLIAKAAEYGEKLGVEVLCGLEAEVFPDPVLMAPMNQVLQAYPWDFIIGSLHHQLPIYRAWLRVRGYEQDREIIDTYFRHLAEGIPSRRYHTIGHPDVIRIYGTVEHFEPADHEPAIRHFLNTLLDNDVCMEVNTSGLIKGVYQVHPDPLILKWAAAMGVKLTMGSDAHRPEQVAQHFEAVLELLRECGFEHIHYFRGGQRNAVKIEDALAVEIPEATEDLPRVAEG